MKIKMYCCPLCGALYVNDGDSPPVKCGHLTYSWTYETGESSMRIELTPHAQEMLNRKAEREHD